MQFERNVGLLVNRLRTEDAYRRHPEIADERIERPLVIVGLARTGTTMLHRMMASDPRWLALLWYESRNPAPFPDSEGAAVDPRITDAEAEVATMLEGSPDLIAAHPMDAHAPDEEIMLVEHAFTSWNPEAFCRVPSYSAYLDTIDLAPGYRYLLRLLRSSSGRSSGAARPRRAGCSRRPTTWARSTRCSRRSPTRAIAMTHRDPVQTVPSLASLVRTLYVLGSDSVDPLEIGAHWSQRWARALERAIAARAKREDRFLDVHYAELVADPMAQVRRIYAHAGLELTAEAEARMRQWAVENERDRRPVHAYTLEEFGYTQRGSAPRLRGLLRAVSGRADMNAAHGERRHPRCSRSRPRARVARLAESEQHATAGSAPHARRGATRAGAGSYRMRARGVDGALGHRDAGSAWNRRLPSRSTRRDVEGVPDRRPDVSAIRRWYFVSAHLTERDSELASRRSWRRRSAEAAEPETHGSETGLMRSLVDGTSSIVQPAIAHRQLDSLVAAIARPLRAPKRSPTPGEFRSTRVISAEIATQRRSSSFR